MSGSPKADRWGRPLSEDGRWFWDGQQWNEVVELPPLPYAEPSATPPPAVPTSEPSVAPTHPEVPAEHPAGFLEISPDGKWGRNADGWVLRSTVSPGPTAPIHPTAHPAPETPTFPTPTHAAEPTPAPTTPPPAHPVAPVPSPPPPQDLAAGGLVFHPEGEAKRYPTMWRPAGRALRDVPGLLEPGEVVLATAPGEGDMAELRHLVGLTILTGYHFDPAYLLVATDRRVLALGLTASASKVQRVHAFAYRAITHWSARMSRAATLVTRTGFIALAAEPDEAAGMKRVPGHLLDEVRAQIEPRLDPSLRQGDRS